MTKLIIMILVVFLIGFALYVIITHFLTINRIVKEFKHCNVIVFGKKGNGKDLLTQEVIYKRRKENYFSNIDYGYKYHNANVSSLELTPNTYENFINGEVSKIKKINKYENADFYLSDCGIILPSQFDTKLYKQYPSFGASYALSRHLYHNNIHCNTQNLGRVWKALREQADYYIKCRGVIKLPFLLVVKTTEYEKYESAEKSLLPYHIPLIGRQFQQAEAKQYRATNGFIKNGFVIVLKKHIHYDTRAYHKILFGKKSK